MHACLGRVSQNVLPRRAVGTTEESIAIKRQIFFNYFQNFVKNINVYEVSRNCKELNSYSMYDRICDTLLSEDAMLFFFPCRLYYSLLLFWTVFNPIYWDINGLSTQKMCLLQYLLNLTSILQTEFL